MEDRLLRDRWIGNKNTVCIGTEVRALNRGRRTTLIALASLHRYVFPPTLGRAGKPHALPSPGGDFRNASRLQARPPSGTKCHMSDEDTNYEYQKRLHAAYSEQRSKADEIAFEIGGRYEKMLSLVAGGALVVSLTFIEKMAPSPLPGTRWIALLSWGCLGTAVIACLYAISASQKAQQKKIENMDSEILQKLYPDDPRYKDLDVTSNPFAQGVRRANGVSLWSAILGLISLVLFAFLNFPSEKQYERSNSSQTKPAARGDHSTNQHLRSDQEPSGTAATTSSQTGEVTMPKESTPPSPPPPPKPMQETRGSYIPTQNQVAPPPPPSPSTKPANPPAQKDG